MKPIRFIGLCAGLFLAACSPEIEPATIIEDNPYLSAADKVVTLDGDRVRYRVDGPADAPTLIMLHGFTDSLNGWDRLASALDDEYRIIRPDLPGHGLSGMNGSGDYSNEALAKFVGAFIKETTDSPPILIGNSLGGLAAWHVAADDPDAIAALVLIAPGGVPHNGIGETPVEVPAMLRFYLSKAPEAGVRAALRAMYGDPDLLDEADIARFVALMRQPGNGEAFTARAAQFTLPDPMSDLAQITAPTLIIWGEADGVLPPAYSEIFDTAIADSRVLRLPGVGHLPQAEAADEVAAAIRAFSATLRAPETP
ncbi:alpha/beta hydrolase [Algimonas arctica]|uniref:Alpha/beta hydrolase n=1 Tax=Algimonas arctica TaxID=1479486 RepID=A0A8J3CPX0_9PROT|nr:alpha/beta fold hydrolase [Algimonas arctica]GHA84660.1 alpha/beta hydrolase [Algimonas arctica]